MSTVFQINKKVFIKPLRVSGVVKSFDNGKVVVEYFLRNSKKRQTNAFDPSMLEEYRDLKSNNSKDRDNKYYYAVRKFHKLFNHQLSYKPQPMDGQTALKRMSWILEEVVEFLHASASNKEEFTQLYDQLVVSGYGSFLKLTNTDLPEDKLTAQVDAAGDMLYFNQGDFNILGVKPDGVFNAIQKSNMKKLWPDGKPRFREEDDKIIKPDNWESPEKYIKKEIDKQIK